MRVLIVLPTYNEAGNIINLLERIKYIRKFFSHNINVLVIDDNSPDGTGRLAKEYSKFHPWVYVFVRRGKLGLGSALLLGFKYAYTHGYDCVISMDADLQHNPLYIPRMVKALSNGVDVVVASRYVTGGNVVGWSLLRRIVSLVANLYARCLLRLGVSDVTTGYKCYSRRAIAIIIWSGIFSRGYSIQPETLYIINRHGLSVSEIPFVFVSRAAGKSKMDLGVILEFFYLVPQLLAKHKV